jgi:hypothetical protein
MTCSSSSSDKKQHQQWSKQCPSTQPATGQVIQCIEKTGWLYHLPDMGRVEQSRSCVGIQLDAALVLGH